MIGIVDSNMPRTNHAVPGKSNVASAPEGAAFFMPGRLTLEDGKVFQGHIPVWQKDGQFNAEVVFNTGMTGYVESVTDPSYHNQILVFTYPLIGNYGVNEKDGESNKIQAAGAVMSELATNWSHDAADKSFKDWFESQNVPLITGVDTRALTKYLRTRGTMLGAISADEIDAKSISIEQSFVSLDKPRTYNEGASKKVVLVDCGAKENILRNLLSMDLEVLRVPYDYDFSNEDYDGVLLSNGPGDPTDYAPTIENVKKAITKDKPIFGICLGSQLLGLAAGGSTYKLKFGHRGHNQPCLNDGEGRAYITSQNHGYALDEKTLPDGWRVNFRNLNDDSVEGIEHVSKPFFAVQFHPEACPGPTDTSWLFERFRKSL
jgi:carbamoyl-phosphate synthase small subunit